MIAVILMAIGTALLAFGWWLITTTADPLGYSPPDAYLPAGLGAALLSIGILAGLYP